MRCVLSSSIIPVTITLLDSEGYRSSRDVQPGPASVHQETVLASPTSVSDNMTQTHYIEVETFPTNHDPNTHDVLISRLEFFHDELVKCNAECSHWKFEFNKLSDRIKKLTRNQTFEIRLLQKAVLAQQRGKNMNKGHGDHISQYAKVLIERNNLIEIVSQKAKDSAEWKTQYRREADGVSCVASRQISTVSSSVDYPQHPFNTVYTIHAEFASNCLKDASVCTESTFPQFVQVRASVYDY